LGRSSACKPIVLRYSYCCSEEEAQQIHEAAKRERRTLSVYILNVVMSRIKNTKEAVRQMKE
jgi:hypothetical protein